MLIVNCPIQDDDLILRDEQKIILNNKYKKIFRIMMNEIIINQIQKKLNNERKKSPSIERPISITVKLNSDEFDLRQLIKKRRTDESSSKIINVYCSNFTKR